MHKPIVRKTTVRKSILLGSAFAVMLLGFSTTSLADNPATINVNASGNIDVLPDYIHVYVNIEKTKKTKTEAKTEVDRITQKVLDAAKKLNIKDKHIQASDIFARPQYQWNSNNKQIHTGEVVTRSVSIKLYELGSYSALAADLMKIDITNMSQNGFGYDNIEQHQNQALVSALEKAKAKADLIASTLGVKLSGVFQVNESGGDMMPVYHLKGARAEMMMADAGPQEAPLEVKPQTINANVNVSFLIKP